jgi:hypothetical protein
MGFKESAMKAICLIFMFAVACSSGQENGEWDGDVQVDDVPLEDTVVEDVSADDVRVDDVQAEEAAQDPVAEDPPVEDVQEEEVEPFTCLPDTSCRNGSEECDDQGFTVPDPYVPLVLACLNGNNGIAFVSETTGPACTVEESCSGEENNMPRCQGYENCLCVHFWDHADYNPLFTLQCTEAGLTLDIDLSAFAGQHLYVGSHDNPDGSGHMTEICLGRKNL